MNIMNADTQLGVTYTLTPSLYLTGQPIIISSPLLMQNMVTQRELKLETSLKQLQLKYAYLLQQNEELKDRIESMGRQGQINPNRRKFIRRKEDELDKKYKCCFDNCKKQYASTLALNLHIKNKHKGTTKKQMDDLAKKIIEAELRGQEIGSEMMKLPEGYLDIYKRQHMIYQSSTSQQSSLQQ